MAASTLTLSSVSTSDATHKVITALRAKARKKQNFIRLFRRFSVLYKPSLTNTRTSEISGFWSSIVEPECVIMFRVCWLDDQGGPRINRGFRIQMNNALRAL